MKLSLLQIQAITKIMSQNGIPNIRVYPGTIRMELPSNKQDWQWMEMDPAGLNTWHIRFTGFDGHEIELARLDNQNETEIINYLLKNL